MSDSSSFTSLMDLVESHLSKTSLQASQSNDDSRHLHFAMPNLNGIQKGLSDTILSPPNKILPIPRLSMKNSDITEVLAQQVTNMLIAKEKREQEEKQKLAEQMEKMKLKEQEEERRNYVIDLMPAIIPQEERLAMLKKPTPVMSNSSSFESLLSEWNKEIAKASEPKPKEELLPITTDMSYILFQKIKKGKCSPFGRVLSARYRPVAAPYLKTEIHNPAIVRFDFSTKSPCDINIERRLNPPPCKYAHMNMVEKFMATTNEDGF